MKRYRFKTKDEFIRDGLWDYDDDCPKYWNAEGKMNHFLGIEITDQRAIYQCEEDSDFYSNGWSFRSSDYVELEDYSGRQVRALVDNPHCIDIKKGEIITLTKGDWDVYNTSYNGRTYGVLYPLDLTKWELVDGPEQQKYYDNLSQHVGRYLKTLVDHPHGGGVKKGEYGLITSSGYVDFPSQKNYACPSALSTIHLGKSYELMPEGVPMLVGDDGNFEEGKIRSVIGTRGGFYYAWDKHKITITHWLYAKPLKSVVKKVTLKEVTEKFGVERIEVIVDEL